MSSKDNKPDLSNLKSRLGLKKSGGGDKSPDEAKSDKTDSGGGGAVTGSGPQRTKQRGSGPQRTKKSGSGGVDDRLAALKKSKLKSKRQPEPAQQPQEQSPATSGARQPATGASDGFDDFSATSQPREQAGASAQPGAGQQPGAAQSAGARPQTGPPPGAQGPPPTAKAPPTSQRQTASATSEQRRSPEDEEEIDLEDFDLDDGGIFSPAAVVVLVVLTALGFIFGYFLSDSLDARAIQQSRIDDAQSMQEDLQPKVEAFERAHEIIHELADGDSVNIDFEAAEELRQLDFMVNASIIPRDRMLLADRQIIGPLNRIMGTSDALYRLTLDHYRETTRADREELEAYQEAMEELEESLDEGEEIAALYSLHGWASDMQSDERTAQQFNPSPGSLVRVPVRPDFDIEEEAEKDFEDQRSRFKVDEDGMITVEFITSGQYGEPPGTHEVSIYDLVPINREHFLSIDFEGNNAAQRYEHRVGLLEEYANDMARQLELLEEALEEVANEEVPLFSIGTRVDDEADDDDDEAESEEPEE